MFMQTLCKKGMKMKKAVNTLNLYLPPFSFHDGSYQEVYILYFSARFLNLSLTSSLSH